MGYLENLTSGHIGLIVGVIAILVIITVWSFVKKRTVRGSGFPIDIAPSETESINEAIGVLPDAGDAGDKPTTIILPEDPKPYNADVRPVEALNADARPVEALNADARPVEASNAMEHLGQLNETMNPSFLEVAHEERIAASEPQIAGEVPEPVATVQVGNEENTAPAAPVEKKATRKRVKKETVDNKAKKPAKTSKPKTDGKKATRVVKPAAKTGVAETKKAKTTKTKAKTSKTTTAAKKVSKKGK